MVDLEQVTSDLYLLPLPIREGWSGSMLLVLGAETVGLIDTGFAQTPTELIFPAVKQLGRRLSDLRFVVNTHRDRDHVEGNAQIKAHTSATIAAHELAAEAIEGVDETFSDNAVVKLGDRQFRVIHAPGHRPGNICLYDESAQLLITGDTVCGTRTNLIRMDPAIHIASLQRLLTLDLQLLVMAHPFQPMGKNVLHGSECVDMIKASIHIAETM